ncbi:hypothetical protein GXW82_12440 [Streptacidiphilus sp. 4-A2]|nr:hypothetical protein [Streptacidiphilus sp. 4-A2]
MAVAGPGARVRALGCDLELRGLPLQSAHIVLDPAAVDWLDRVAETAGPAAAQQRLLAAFSAKEAAFKAFAALLPPALAPAVLLDLATRAVPGGFLVWPQRLPGRVLRVRVHRAGPGVFSWTAASAR